MSKHDQPRLRSTLVYLVIAGLVVTVLAVGAWFLVPLYAPDFAIRNSPWAGPAMRGLQMKVDMLHSQEDYKEMLLERHGENLLPSIESGLSGNNDIWWGSCAQMLSDIPESPRRSAMLMRLIHGTRPAARRLGVESYPWASLPDGTAQLCTLLLDPDIGVRSAAFGELPLDQVEPHRALYLQAIEEPRGYGRTAINRLLKLANPKNAEDFRAAFLHTKDTRAKLLLMDGLEAIPDWSQETQALYRQALIDQEDAVAQQALTLLNKHQAPVPLAQIRSMLKRPCYAHMTYNPEFAGIYDAIAGSGEPESLGFFLSWPSARVSCAHDAINSLATHCPRPWPTDPIRTALLSNDDALIAIALCLAAHANDASLLPDIRSCAAAHPESQTIQTCACTAQTVLSGVVQMDHLSIEQSDLPLLAYFSLFARDADSQLRLQHALANVEWNWCARALADGSFLPSNYTNHHQIDPKYWPQPTLPVPSSARLIGVKALAEHPKENQAELKALSSNSDPAIAAIASAALGTASP